MFIADGWKEYEILDATQGERLERWGQYVTVRPDPQVIWKSPRVSPLWEKADGVYHRSSSGGGRWENRRLPAQWTLQYRDLTLRVRPMGFKHTGIFPEQAANWDFMRDLIRNAGRPVNVLNLFGYTGAASIACAAEGASVCHVDAAKAMVATAKENAQLSGLADRPIRYITDDCVKFAEREIRRGHRYDGIVMDPPSYGRGPSGELWKVEDDVYALLELCSRLMSDKPLFFLINSYTTGLSPSVMAAMQDLLLRPALGGKVECGELGLPVGDRFVVPCGAVSRWTAE